MSSCSLVLAVAEEDLILKQDVGRDSFCVKKSSYAHTSKCSHGGGGVVVCRGGVVGCGGGVVVCGGV